MRRIFFIIAMVMAGLCFDPVSCFALSETEEGEGVNVQHIIFEHMLDSYTWHITKVGDKDIAVYLPVILYSKTSGWHVFSSRRLHENGGSYEGFRYTTAGGGIVEVYFYSNGDDTYMIRLIRSNN